MTRPDARGGITAATHTAHPKLDRRRHPQALSHDAPMHAANRLPTPCAIAAARLRGRWAVCHQAEGIDRSLRLARAAACMAAGRPVWMAGSGNREDKRRHSGLRTIFRARYRGVERHLNDGWLLRRESANALCLWYRAPERGEIVLVVAGLPPAPGRAGRQAPRMGGHCQLAAVEARPDTRQTTSEACQRLFRQLMHKPGRGWAAHPLHDSPSGAAPPGLAADVFPRKEPFR